MADLEAVYQAAHDHAAALSELACLHQMDLRIIDQATGLREILEVELERVRADKRRAWRPLGADRE